MRRRFAIFGEALYLVEHYTLHTYGRVVYPQAYIFGNFLRYSASSFFDFFLCLFVLPYLNLEMHPLTEYYSALSNISCYVDIDIKRI